jgi:hypothetical protein
MITRHTDRRLALIISIAALLGGCTGSASPSPSTATVAPTASPTTTPSATAGVVASVLEVTCTASGTEIGASQVAAQRDGVHIDIANSTGERRLFAIDEVGGSNVPRTGVMMTQQMPTGSARIQCGPADGSSRDWVAIEVVDPDGHYVPDEVDCRSVVSGSIDYVSDATGPKGKPVGVARRQITGLQADDQVERAGYAKASNPKVRVVRDGSVVAVGSYFSDHAGGWLISDTTVCKGSGLKWGA